MADDKLMSLQSFWERNQLTKVQYYYLRRIGRGPREIPIGTKVTISPIHEAEWCKEMAERPVTGSLRKLAEAVQSSSEAA